MHSMTGFGLGEAPLGAGRLLLDLRSLNHRYLEVRVRVPPELAGHAFFVEQLTRARLTRGRFDVGVRLQGAALPPPRLVFERARSVYEELSRLRDELAPGTPLPLATLIQVPGIFLQGIEVADEAVYEAIEKAFELAYQRLDAMRRSEGQHLCRELTTRLDVMRGLTEQCAQRARETVCLIRSRLRERVGRVVAESARPLDTDRVEQEVVLLADRYDVTEEISRLASHFAQMASLLTSEEPSGRRLDFLLQEISREANTLGAKSQDAVLSHLVVELKSETERMREQVQNVE